MDQEFIIEYAQVSKDSFIVKSVRCVAKDLLLIMTNLEEYFQSFIIDVRECRPAFYKGGR
jgi:hypothetical protein